MFCNFYNMCQTARVSIYPQHTLFVSYDAITVFNVSNRGAQLKAHL